MHLIMEVPDYYINSECVYVCALYVCVRLEEGQRKREGGSETQRERVRERERMYLPSNESHVHMHAILVVYIT